MRSKLLAGAILITLAFGAVAALLSSRATAEPELREIVLVARGMSFYVEGSDQPNPVLQARAGERLRLVVRNESPGMTHDLAVDTLRVATQPLAAGQIGSLDLQIPDTAGRHEYHCRPHAVMMRGVIEVAR